jgi:hypothetical protein
MLCVGFGRMLLPVTPCHMCSMVCDQQHDKLDSGELWTVQLHVGCEHTAHTQHAQHAQYLQHLSHQIFTFLGLRVAVSICSKFRSGCDGIQATKVSRREGVLCRDACMAVASGTCGWLPVHHATLHSGSGDCAP